LKKLSVLRSEFGTPCPFGLSVGIGCQNAGDSVAQMQPLEGLSEDRVERQREHNVAVYSMQGGGRCIYADSLVEAADAVHCDFGEPGAAIKDIPSPAISRGPVKYQPGGLAGYYSYPVWSYMDNPYLLDIFQNTTSGYVLDGRMLKAAWWNEPSQELLKLIERFASENKNEE
jgi:hypothetical protein